MRTIVHALATLFLEQPSIGQGHHQLHHVRRTIDDGGIDHRALAGLPSVENAGEQADGQVQRTTTDVADQGDGRRRCFASGTAVVQRTGQGDVIVVMAGRVGHRAMLPPAGHAPVDQARVTGTAFFRPQAQALHDTRAHTLDQDVGTFDELEYDFTPFWCFQVSHDRALATVERVAHGIFLTGDRGGCTALDSDHIGAQIGQVHGTERPWADATNFYDLDSRQHWLSSFVMTRTWGSR
ncbi:hypothetical protein D9M71_512910 [compost metagenome]